MLRSNSRKIDTQRWNYSATNNMSRVSQNQRLNVREGDKLRIQLSRAFYNGLNKIQECLRREVMGIYVIEPEVQSNVCLLMITSAEQAHKVRNDF